MEFKVSLQLYLRFILSSVNITRMEFKDVGRNKVIKYHYRVNITRMEFKEQKRKINFR